jgi:hypothetical protein
MLDLADSADTKFIQDQLRQFTRQQEMKSLILDSAEKLNAGNAGVEEEIAERWRTYLADSPSTKGRVLTTRPLDKFEYREVEWFWWPFVPLREVTNIYGLGEVGKSTVTLDMAVRTAAGRAWPRFGEEEREYAPRGSVLLMTKEDDPDTVIRPRLEAAGADRAILKRIHIVGFDVPDDAKQFDPLDRPIPTWVYSNKKLRNWAM